MNQRDSLVVGAMCLQVNEESSHLENILILACERIELSHYERLLIRVNFDILDSELDREFPLRNLHLRNRLQEIQLRHDARELLSCDDWQTGHVMLMHFP